MHVHIRTYTISTILLRQYDRRGSTHLHSICIERDAEHTQQEREERKEGERERERNRFSMREMHIIVMIMIPCRRTVDG